MFKVWFLLLPLLFSNSLLGKELSELEKYIPFGTYRGLSPRHQEPGNPQSAAPKNYACKVHFKKVKDRLEITVYTLQYQESLSYRQKRYPVESNTARKKQYNGFQTMTYKMALKDLARLRQDRVRVLSSDESGFYLHKRVNKDDSLIMVNRQEKVLEEKVYLTLEDKYFNLRKIHISQFIFDKTNQRKELRTAYCNSLQRL